MERHVWLSLSVIVAIIAITISFHECDARMGGFLNRKKPLHVRRYFKGRYPPSSSSSAYRTNSNWTFLLDSKKRTRLRANDYSSYFNSAAGAALMPAGGVHYPNTATIPPNAIFTAKPPRRLGSGSLLFRKITDHMISDSIFRSSSSMTHKYQQNPEQLKQQHSVNILVTNNGTATVVIFEPRRAQSTSPPPPPVYGIICMPIMLNETNLSDPKSAQQVNRTICFPAPPPPSQVVFFAGGYCIMSKLVVLDPNEVCRNTKTKTTTIKPLEVSRKIGETVSSEAKSRKVLTTSEEVKEQERRKTRGRRRMWRK